MSGAEGQPRRGRRPSRGAAAAAAALALLAARGARADGFTLQLQPTYSLVHTENTDASGTTSVVDSQTFVQRYRLTLDRTLYPNLRLSAGGLYDWTLGTYSPRGEPDVDVDSQKWTGYARLSLGGPTLNAGAGYDRREEFTRTRTGGETLRSPTLIRDVFSLSARWAPAELPAVDLRASRTSDRDRAREVADTTTDTALVLVRFDPVKQVNLRYNLGFAELSDRIRDLDTTEIRNSAQVTWADRFLGGRLSTYANYVIRGLTSETRVGAGAGGVVRTQQFPVGGLSRIEAFPDLPTRVTLTANPALVDGDTAATAGLDLGFGRTLAGDTAPRDLGAQFADATVPVDEIWVWVDRALPAEVYQAFTWVAYQSDDNVDWAEVPLAAPVDFDLFQNRFELRVQRIQKRFLKVVARPLAASVTVDPQFREIVVTELQLFQVQTAEEARGRTSSTAGTFNGTARLLILQVPNLTYDLSTFLSHASGRAEPTYTVSNGLTLTHRLSRIYGLNARVERTDSDEGGGHGSAMRYLATLSVDPIPTAGGALTTSGQWLERPEGRSWSNAVGVLGHADPWEGITVFASGMQEFGVNLERRNVTSTTLTAGTTLTPNRVLTATGSGSYQRRTGSTLGTDERGAVEGTVSFSPFPALQATGTASRFFGTGKPSTLASWAVGLSPFQGGALVLRYSHTETLDTGGDLRTRTTGPSVRWNVRPGAYVQASYTMYDSDSPALHSSSDAFFADLLVMLR